jgi:hypothetical protein
MGLNMLFSSSSRDKSCSMLGKISSNNITNNYYEVNNSLPNPNPKNYTILKKRQIGDYLVIKIKYLDCINYEGNKILVFKSDIDKLKAQKYIDPHFCDDKKFISPIARFTPDNEGWNDAIDYCKLKNKKIK